MTIEETAILWDHELLLIAEMMEIQLAVMAVIVREAWKVGIADQEQQFQVLILDWIFEVMAF